MLIGEDAVAGRVEIARYRVCSLQGSGICGAEAAELQNKLSTGSDRGGDRGVREGQRLKSEEVQPLILRLIRLIMDTNVSCFILHTTGGGHQHGHGHGLDQLRGF